MKVQEFLRELPELLRSQLPVGLQDFQTVGPIASLIKLHYGVPSVHYEVWIQRRRSLVEVGLHFEADPDTNARYLESLSGRFPEIYEVLGPSVEPEQWTRSWTRVHESLSLRALEEDFLIEVSSRLSRMVSVLEPMVREASVAGP